MPRTKYRFHPARTVFPQLSDENLQELADDIAVNGLRNPIVLWQGKIVDGRNRYLACRIAEVEPRFTEFEGDDPIGCVISQYLQRRHLTASQNAIVACRCWKRRRLLLPQVKGIPCNACLPLHGIFAFARYP